VAALYASNPACKCSIRHATSSSQARSLAIRKYFPLKWRR
jgi:hypothetical protein